MALIESLLTAIVRADGDALVMHVGEKPYVVASAGPIELSAQGLNLQAMAGMAAQLLPAELQRALTEFGAVEHELPPAPVMRGERFTVVVARGGDDVWIEIRRHRQARPVDATVEEARHVEPLPDLVPVEGPLEPTPLQAAHGDDGYALRGEDADVQVTEPAAAAEPLVPSVETEPLVVERDPELAVIEAAGNDAPAPATSDVPAPMGGLESVIPPDVLAAAESMAVVDTPAASEPTLADEPAVLHESPPAPPQIPEPIPETHVEIPIPPQPPPPDPPPAPVQASSASVIPMTRTLRIEVPRTAPSRVASPRSEIGKLLAVAAARGATALYLTTQSSPFLRVDDDVQILEGEPPMTSVDVEAAVLELMPETTRDALRRGDPTEWVSDFADVGRVRCSTFRDHRGPGAIFQLSSFRPVAAEQLGLSPEIQALATETEGLVLVASPRGHGKSTLIGALVDLINRGRSGYVITLERQIRFVHERDQALISQREVRGTADQLLSVARAALSENPDVLVIDDVPSPEVFQLALDAAGSGRLVFASMTAGSIPAALARILGTFPSDQRKEVQLLLAERLRGAVAQVLLRKVAGGRVAAREVVLATAAVGRVLADGQWPDLQIAIDSGRKHGLVSLTDSLVGLVRTGVIDAREAYRKADDRAALLLALKRENVDTSLVERLA